MCYLIGCSLFYSFVYLGCVVQEHTLWDGYLYVELLFLCESKGFPYIEFVFILAFGRGVRALANFALNIVTLSLWSDIKDYFGDIPMSMIESVIDTMKSQGIIKYSGEGIEVYKDVEFLTR